MHTIFPDYAVNFETPFSKNLSNNNTSQYPSNNFRSSLSPHKLTNKKFYYSVRNKSKKQI